MNAVQLPLFADVADVYTLADRAVAILDAEPGLHRVAVHARLGCDDRTFVAVLDVLFASGRVAEDEWYMLFSGSEPHGRDDE